ncbi:MAG: DMT family transporter, partial [Planctomycetes bacterium]|nr:DMT family transporter [Planctomycetota bacterium]
ILAFSLVWAVYTISIKVCFKDIDVRVGFSVISIYTVIGLGGFALLFGKPAQAFSMGLRPWIYIVVSGVLSIAFAHTLFYTSIKRIGATIPSLVLLVTPFTTLLVSHLVIGESLGAFQLVFGIVLTFGCGLAIWSRARLS